MGKRKRWFWIFLFILLVALMGTLATGWNLVLIEDYRKIVNIARSVTSPNVQIPSRPWVKIVLGSIGFLTLIGGLILAFTKLFQEMKLNQLQTEFLATVSHELKTPLATLELSSSLLKNKDLTPSERDKLWSSHTSELKRLKEQVHALLEAAHFQAKNTQLRPSMINLENWIQESLPRWAQLLGPKIEIQRTGDLLIFDVLSDPHMLELICDNLVDNARKFSKSDPVLIINTSVLQKAINSETRWSISFCDNGWGFNPSEKEKLFYRFNRGKNHGKITVPGSGLGLYLASEASQTMGFKLNAESDGIGKGSRFTLEGTSKLI